LKRAIATEKSKQSKQKDKYSTNTNVDTDHGQRAMQEGAYGDRNLRFMDHCGHILQKVGKGRQVAAGMMGEFLS
jgi:hypothetical protein